MGIVQELKELVQWGDLLTKEQAMQLIDAPLDELTKAADDIRRQFCGSGFDICTIINGKSGKCTENCKYCAQSSHFCTKVEEYPLLPTEDVVKEAKYNDDKGMLRFSIVTSGKALTDEEVDEVCETYKAIHKETGIHTCASHGLLTYEQFCKLREAGVTRIHNNLETSRRNFPNICTTHTYDDKIKAIKAAQQAGMNVCSGGIMGMGETMEDRIDMVLDLRELGVRSIPVNILNPIPGTPFDHLPILTSDEVCRIVAIFRFLVPNASIRMAGGRGLLPDKGRAVFQSGANAAISGDMLTTSGISIDTDKEMLSQLGYEAELWNA
jgi:biotin synthase